MPKPRRVRRARKRRSPPRAKASKTVNSPSVPPPPTALSGAGFSTHQDPPLLKDSTLTKDGEREQRELPKERPPRFDLRKLNLVDQPDLEIDTDDLDNYDKDLEIPRSVSLPLVTTISSDQGPTIEEAELLAVESAFDHFIDSLLHQLEPAVIKAVESKQISFGHKELLRRLMQLIDHAFIPYANEADEIMDALGEEEI